MNKNDLLVFVHQNFHTVMSIIKNAPSKEEAALDLSTHFDISVENANEIMDMPAVTFTDLLFQNFFGNISDEFDMMPPLHRISSKKSYLN